MRILVALSGGIDSSVVAHLLSEQGHELVGVRFHLWSDPLAPPLAQVLPSKCCNAQTIARAKSVASRLGIPLLDLDLSEDFHRDVVDPFLDAHGRGLTPNPCIRCNRLIKFGRLLELADEQGCDAIATGHYARTAVEHLPDGSSRTLLLEAIDAAKDQSYYLYGLTQEQLSRALFPLGSFLKRDVYSLAKQYDVPHDEHYRESQDLCFFPEKSVQPFLRRHLREVLRPGEIIRQDGTVVGIHDGVPLYTIGQRKGLRIGGQRIPLEVVAKDAERNRLIVAPKGSVTMKRVDLREVRWVAWRPPQNEPSPFECRVRSLSPRRPGILTYQGEEATFHFDEAQAVAAPGQSLVLYRGEEVVGGGIIV